MKKKFVDSLTNFIIKNKDCDEKKIKIIRYGLEGLYTTLTKIFVVTVCVLALNSFKEFLLILIAYALVRRYSFGLHANSSLVCWLTTIPIYVGGSLLIKFLDFNSYIIYFVWIFAFISFVLWAPADTPKRPLVRANLRKQQKIKTCIVALIYLIILLFVKSKIVNDAITYALLIQTIMINPLSYRLTKTQFNNYRFYPNKV